MLDFCPKSKLVAGNGDAAVDINKAHYWLIQANDHRKNYGADSCKFDQNIVTAFTPGGWGATNWKYYVNADGSISSAQ